MNVSYFVQQKNESEITSELSSLLGIQQEKISVSLKSPTIFIRYYWSEEVVGQGKNEWDQHEYGFLIYAENGDFNKELNFHPSLKTKDIAQEVVKKFLEWRGEQKKVY